MLQQNSMGEGVRTKKANKRKEAEKLNRVPETSSYTACQASEFLSLRVQLHKSEPWKCLHLHHTVRACGLSQSYTWDLQVCLQEVPSHSCQGKAALFTQIRAVLLSSCSSR